MKKKKNIWKSLLASFVRSYVMGALIYFFNKWYPLGPLEKNVDSKSIFLFSTALAVVSWLLDIVFSFWD